MQTMTVQKELTFFEFFAGGGMARLGLGDGWTCLFANDFDSMKRAAYGENFGLDHHHEGDVAAIAPEELPKQRADLAWASFPCQDLSLAGGRGGLGSARSGAFYGFWRLIEALAHAGRRPRTIVIENVPGLLTSNDGADFDAVVGALADAGYCVSAMMIDARRFSPQSRQRIFIFGFAEDAVPATRSAPDDDDATPARLIAAVEALAGNTRRRWVWLAARPQSISNIGFRDILEDGAAWDAPAKTRALLAAMSHRQRAAIEAMRADGGRHVGSAFKRIRMEGGAKVLRAEARFDNLAGCLRTPAGGSSRQIVIEINDGAVRSRLLTPREAARLMGLPEDYKLPRGVTAALKLCGDGVSSPVVRWIAENILEPALARDATGRRRTAA